MYSTAEQRNGSKHAKSVMWTGNINLDLSFKVYETSPHNRQKWQIMHSVLW